MLPKKCLGLFGVWAIFLLAACAPALPTATPAPTPALLPTNSPTASPVPLPTATFTPDPQIVLLLTQQSILLTQQAILLATDTPRPTPNQTQTAAACRQDYAVVEQSPADGKYLLIGAKVTKTLTLKNTGACAFPPEVTLTETGGGAGAAAVSLAVGALAPGETIQLKFEWPGPARSGVQRRTFELRRPDGARIGEPLTLTFNYVSSQTPTPLVTPTVSLPTLTPTPLAPADLSDMYPNYLTCSYQGDLYYSCSVRLILVGGVGPFKVWVAGLWQGSYQRGEAIVFEIMARRCQPLVYSVNVGDDGSLSVLAKDFYFDPATNPNLFANGQCTLP